jgi:predicted dehydrogenase/nucleoside-diphosphate-sugar epimerase
MKPSEYIILGGGSVTAEFYLPALNRMGRDAGVTIVEPSAASLAGARRIPGRARFVERDYDSYLTERPSSPAEKAEAVIVCLPNRYHVDAVRLALNQGHDVLCEKPLALNAADCVALRNLAQNCGRKLKVAMSRRYLPSLLLARQMVQTGELGRVKSIHVLDCTPFPWKPRSFAFFAPEGGGILADMGVHYMDYLDTLVGPLTPVAYEDDARGGTESSAHYRLEAGQVRIDMRLSRLSRNGAFIEIVCEQGSIRIDKSDEQQILVTRPNLGSRRVALEEPFENTSWPKAFHGSFCQMLADFERACSGGTTGIADVADAERTAALIEWAYARRSKRTVARIGASSESGGADKVLVTGGTGFIGGHLIDRLTEQHHPVRATVRSPASCANLARFPVEMVHTDLLDMDSVRSAMAGAGTVYHLAYGQEGKNAARITIEGTKNVVRAAIEARAKSVVVLSTMYVFGFPAGARPIDETFPYRPYGGEYGESKTVMERWCLEQARSSLPTRIVVLNPTCVFGPGGGAYTCLPVDLARKGEFCWMNNGGGSANYVYVGNLVDAMLAAEQTPAAHGERFIVNDGTVSWRQLLGPFIAPLGLDIPSYSPKEFARMPRFGGPFRIKDMVTAALSAPEVRTVAKRSATIRKAFALSSHLSPSPPMGNTLTTTLSQTSAASRSLNSPEWLASLYSTHRTTFSSEKARATLGWKPRLDLAEAQATTIDWLIDSGWLPGRGPSN